MQVVASQSAGFARGVRPRRSLGVSVRPAIMLFLCGWVVCVEFASVCAQAFASPAAADPMSSVAPGRPADDDRVQALGAALFDAIVHDDAARAEMYFFPRAPFLQVKAMKDPGRYWDRLRARFATDVHALHASLPGLDGATFEHLDLARRGGLVQPGEEGNRLPYWASRHSTLRYRVGDTSRTFEVRVLISWEDRWYVIHLSEFH